MITVLHVIEGLSDFGGTPRVLLYLAKHHADKDIRLVFFCYTPSLLKEEFIACGAEVVEYRTTHPVKLIRALCREVKKWQASVICTHLSRPLIVGTAVARIMGVPLIHTEHTSAAYRLGFARRLAKVCLPSAQAVICNSRYTRDSIRNAYRLADERLHVVYNPVEPRAVGASRAQVRAELELTHEQPVIGHIGGMISSRDQATLIRAFGEMRQRFPDAVLLLIGDGPVRPDLERLTAESGLEGAVRFLGYTDRVGDYLHAMDVYVNPTLDEGFGIAVVEAMMAGVPVVLAERGAHPELVDHDKNGLLYPGGDVAALRHHLEALIAEPARGTQLAERARERAQAFLPRRYATECSDVVKTVLEKNAHRRSSTEWIR